jgi:hypothetical protein
MERGIYQQMFRRIKMKVVLRGLLVGAALVIACGQMALATPELQLISGSSNTGPLSGTFYSNANFNGWDISFVIGSSHSPGLQPFGIRITSLTATCDGGLDGCSANPLEIFFSDNGFTQASPGFMNFYSMTDTGSTASTTQNAWVDPGNTDLAETNSLGSVGPFVGGNSFSGSVGTIISSGPTQYSLTLEDIFTAGGGSASFGGSGTLTSVPEPAAISLLGGVLLVLGSRLRKRLG